MGASTPLRPARSTHVPDERGHATAEYAVGTLGAAVIGGVLIHLCAGDDSWIDHLFSTLWRDVLEGVKVRPVWRFSW